MSAKVLQNGLESPQSFDFALKKENEKISQGGDLNVKFKLIIMRKISKGEELWYLHHVGTGLHWCEPLEAASFILGGQTRVRASPARHLRCKLCNMCARTNTCTLRAQTCVYRARTYVCMCNLCARRVIRDHAASCGTKCIRRTLAPPVCRHHDCPQQPFPGVAGADGPQETPVPCSSLENLLDRRAVPTQGAR